MSAETPFTLSASLAATLIDAEPIVYAALIPEESSVMFDPLGASSSLSAWL